MAQEKIPDALLRVTVRQKEDGKIDKGLHMMTLICRRGECSLKSVSINQCGKSVTNFLGGKSAPIVVETSSTESGNLRVTNEINSDCPVLLPGIDGK